jgi:hypothetical protein
MDYIEKKTDDGYEYETEDVFGKLKITAGFRIDADTLDLIALSLIKTKTVSPVLRGETAVKKGKITYEMIRACPWEDDESDNE